MASRYQALPTEHWMSTRVPTGDQHDHRTYVTEKDP